MSMRWKSPEQAGGARRAKARMVVHRYTDPDLTKVRSAARTISRLGRQTLLQACSSKHWNLNTELKTTTFFLQGDKEAETARNIYGEPHPEVRNKVNLTNAQVEGSVCGLRTAARNRWKYLTSTLPELFWRGQQLEW